MLQPTIITLVPRVLSKIASAIQAATIDAPGFKGKLSRAALAGKYARMDGPNPTFNHPLWDRIWSRKIRQVLGGKVRVLVSGSAPAGRETLRFLRAALACDVLEGIPRLDQLIVGYGLTETFASSLLSLPGDFTPGHCGPVVPTAELRLKDVPDMNYTANDLPNPRGELLVRGHVVFKRYFKDEQKTAEAFDGDWFRTGDICEIDKAGRVYIIDRVKNFFKVTSRQTKLTISWLKGSIFHQNVSKIFTVHSLELEQFLSMVIARKPILLPLSAPTRSHLRHMHLKFSIVQSQPRNWNRYTTTPPSERHY